MSRPRRSAKQRAVVTVDPFTPGSSIGPYALVRELGRGGMGRVFLAQDTAVGGRLVAVKVILAGQSESDLLQLRFQREVQSLGRLRHPNIVTILTAGKDSGHSYFVMNYVPGRDLNQFVAECALLDSSERILRIVEQLERVARAVAYAHGKGVVHRDLKPANIIVADESDEPMVLDFGIAKCLDDTTLTSGSSPGTPAFEAPEQIEPQRTTRDELIDVWALGVVLYRCIADSLPFKGESSFAMARSILRDEPATLAALVPDVPPALDQLVTACLAKDPADRPQHAASVADALQHILLDGWPSEDQPEAEEAASKAGQERSDSVEVDAGTAMHVSHRGVGRTVRWLTGIGVALAAIIALAVWDERRALPSDRGDQLAAAGDAVGAAKAYGEACEAGDPPSCTRLGLAHLEGRGVEKSVPLARSRFEKGCNGGELRGCAALGDLYADPFNRERDDARAVSLYRRACDGGELIGCSGMGFMYLEGRGIDRDEARGLMLLRQGCDAGDPSSCTGLGGAYGWGIGVERDEARAVGLLRQGCDGAHAQGCTLLGRLYANGQGIEKDQALAAKLYRRACEGGNPEGCSNLADAYLTGSGLDRDEVRALVLYRQSCDLGDEVGCADLGTLYLDGKGTKPDEARAATLFRQACEGGHAFACGKLAYLYKTGRGVSKNDEQANTLYERACEAGDHLQCYVMGAESDLIWSAAEGVDPDDAQATSFLRQACDANNGRGCLGLAGRYLTGRGVEKDEVRAFSLAGEVCDRDRDPAQSLACLMLAGMYWNGQGVKQDKGRATTMFKKSCDEGRMDACMLLGSNYVLGWGVKNDVGRGVTLLAQACDGGDANACDFLGRVYLGNLGVKPDRTRAVKLFRQACDDGNRDACSRLVEMNEERATPTP